MYYIDCHIAHPKRYLGNLIFFSLGFTGGKEVEITLSSPEVALPFFFSPNLSASRFEAEYMTIE